jgi:hypothetical protein
MRPLVFTLPTHSQEWHREILADRVLFVCAPPMRRLGGRIGLRFQQDDKTTPVIILLLHKSSYASYKYPFKVTHYPT